MLKIVLFLLCCVVTKQNDGDLFLCVVSCYYKMFYVIRYIQHSKNMLVIHVFTIYTIKSSGPGVTVFSFSIQTEAS